MGEAHGGRGAVAAVARRHGVCTNLICRWRRQLESKWPARLSASLTRSLAKNR
ncbi:hypothetical protein [Azospirillum brasilense]|uniref:hypothetical protein n=1 Tax=Azospirillum brasilense TaxID=192 RepID=UPI003CE58347